MPLEDLPDWLPAWCLDNLGGEPADVLFQLQQVSVVFGLRLPGPTDVVVKARIPALSQSQVGQPAGSSH